MKSKYEREESSGVVLDEFDLAVESLRGRPDTVDCETTLHTSEAITGRKAMTYIVRRFRVRKEGDTVFLTVIDKNEAKRIILPPKVMAVFARQDTALTAKLRTRIGREQAEERKAKGIEPAFLKKASER